MSASIRFYSLICAVIALLMIALSACSQPPNASDPRAQVLIVPKARSGYVPEDNHDVKCPTDQMLWMRYHREGWSGPTEYFCALAHQIIDIPVENVRKSEPIYEHLDIPFTCGKNEVMTGRGHFGKDDGLTWYYCGTPLDYWGNALHVSADPEWTPAGSEWYSGGVACPPHKVMVGRWHKGDSGGPTKYLCAALF